MERPAGAAAPLPWRDRAPLLLGHRGAPRLAHENTLASFRAALLAGLDGLETDPHLDDRQRELVGELRALIPAGGGAPAARRTRGARKRAGARAPKRRRG